MFQKHFGQEISPKALRSSFITWLRDSTTCPEILKSAAHAQTALVGAAPGQRLYDTQRDTRLCKAAFEFNSTFCSSFNMPAVAIQQKASPARATRGSSSNVNVVIASRVVAPSAMHLLKCNHADCEALPNETRR